MRNQSLNTVLVNYNYLTGNKVELQDVNGDYTGEITDERSANQNIRVVLIKNKGKTIIEANGKTIQYDATAVHMGARVIPDGAFVYHNSDTFVVEGALETVNHTKYYLNYKHNG